MSEKIVKILESNYVTHDVKRFTVERPKDFEFTPGQATDVCINAEGWKDKLRPFTFTGLMDWEYLEFMIKIYASHHGVTDMLGHTNAGAELILHDVFGSITYKGPGVFIAAGAGITPFVAILRHLHKHTEMEGHKLIYSNKTSKDVILKDELTEILGDNFINIYTREQVIGYLDRRIDKDFLIDNINDFGQNFYVCGPDAFVKDVNAHLLELGAKAESLVFEK